MSAKREKAFKDLPDHIKRYASVAGQRVCINCGKPFHSEDVMRVRYCGACKSGRSPDGVADVVSPAI